MKLPNGHRADLGMKLEEYVLNPLHRTGQHKARVFESALGITLASKNLLADALRQAAKSSDQAVSLGDNGFGETFALRFAVTTGTGQAVVQSAWIVRSNEDFPRLTTCFIV